jgi:uncharacterized membrane protein
MKKIHFPPIFEHHHPQLKSVNELVEERKTASQKFADRVAIVLGSWKFITIQSFILLIWVFLNIAVWINHWDPYPFILMNLVLSLQAAYTAPIIMMSQNRQADRDRLEAHNDYLINVKAEEEIRVIMDNLAAQNLALQNILDLMTSQLPKSNSSMNQ